MFVPCSGRAAPRRSVLLRHSLADRMSRDKRSALMSKVRGRNTRPEMQVRRALHAAGLRFRLHQRHLPGNPDIVLPGIRTIVFVHGCFWHGHECPKGQRRPNSNIAFWGEKLDRNGIRDQRVQADLVEAGWQVKIVWECDLTDGLSALVEELILLRARRRVHRLD
ncbi:MAG TPA: very short patch repair endonuclease [Allosphingosinicella sp.]